MELLSNFIFELSRTELSTRDPSIVVFFFLMLKNLANLSDSAVFLSHHCINNSIITSNITQHPTKTSGIIPMKPWKELSKIFCSIFVLSLIAVGAKSMKTPILQISSKSTKGTTRNKIEGMLTIYFWSILGPQA